MSPARARRDPDRGGERFIIDKMERDQSWRMFRIMGEFVEGFDRLHRHDPSVTIYGSARAMPGDAVYDDTERLGALFAEAGYAVVTGGGPGVMEAANKGALEAGGESIGLSIDIEGERPNPYTTLSVDFHYFFVRKVMLVWRATAFVLMPGGLGTLDELFETLTLMATEKVQRFPVILYGSDYWGPLCDWLAAGPLERGLLDSEALAGLTITDDLEQVVREVGAWRARHELPPPRIG